MLTTHSSSRGRMCSYPVRCAAGGRLVDCWVGRFDANFSIEAQQLLMLAGFFDSTALCCAAEFVEASAVGVGPAAGRGVCGCSASLPSCL